MGIQSRWMLLSAAVCVRCQRWSGSPASRALTLRRLEGCTRRVLLGMGPVPCRMDTRGRHAPRHVAFPKSGNSCVPAPICEEAGKANADEPARQDMEHEATEKLFGSYRHLALFAAVSVVLPPEGDLAVGDGQEAVIGDGDAMCVAGQVVEHMLRPSEGAFRIDHPILTKERPEERAKSLLLGQWLEAAGEREFALMKGALQAGDELAAKHAAQYLTGKKKA